MTIKAKFWEPLLFFGVGYRYLNRANVGGPVNPPHCYGTFWVLVPLLGVDGESQGGTCDMMG